MINTKGKKLIENKYSEMKPPSRIVHYGEFPMSHYGYTSDDKLLLSYLIDSDDKNDTDQFIEMVIDEKILKDFFDKKISYLDILKTTKAIYIVNICSRKESFEAYEINLDDIPEYYMPPSNSFCPDLIYKDNVYVCDINNVIFKGDKNGWTNCNNDTRI